MTTATDTAPKRAVRFNFLLDNEPRAESQTVEWAAGWSADDICAHLKQLGETETPKWGIPDARCVLFYVDSETPERVEITCRGFRDPADARAHVERRTRRLKALERYEELRAEGEQLQREADAFDANLEAARREKKAAFLSSKARQLEAEAKQVTALGQRRSEILSRAKDWKSRMASSNEELARLADMERELAARAADAPDAASQALDELQATAADIAGSLRDLVKQETKPERKTVTVERDPGGAITGMTVDEAA